MTGIAKGKTVRKELDPMFYPDLESFRAAVANGTVDVAKGCRHMANRFALPKTIAVVTQAGYRCPAIVTPEDYMRENLDD